MCKLKEETLKCGQPSEVYCNDNIQNGIQSEIYRNFREVQK